MQSFNVMDQLAPEGSFGPVGEIRLMPDLGSFALLPYAPRTARLLCGMGTVEGDPSCNPYLALGGLLAAGLDGLAGKLDPGEPVLVDPDTLGEAERVRRGIRRHPASLGEALDALERDEVLAGAMGPMLFKEYLVVKRSEVQAFHGKDAAFEIEHHFYKY